MALFKDTSQPKKLKDTHQLIKHTSKSEFLIKIAIFKNSIILKISIYDTYFAKTKIHFLTKGQFTRNVYHKLVIFYQYVFYFYKYIFYFSNKHLVNYLFMACIYYKICIVSRQVLVYCLKIVYRKLFIYAIYFLKIYG